MHNKFGRNWAGNLGEKFKNITITIYDYVNFDPKIRNLLFNEHPLDLYKFDGACPEVSKYLNG